MPAKADPDSLYTAWKEDNRTIELPTANFTIDFSAYEELTLKARYSQPLKTYKEGENQTYSFFYLTRTGKAWNRSIEKAVFTIMKN